MCYALLCLVLLLRLIAAQSSTTTTTVLGTSDPNAALALSDAASSYQMLSGSSITIDITTPTAGDETIALAALLNGTLDFISTTLTLSPSLSTVTSPLYSSHASDLLWCPYLIAPLVPIYRLDSITGSVPLALSTATLCAIYTGAITYWNDSRIAANNPTLISALPPLPITVVTESSPTSLTLAFTQALSTQCGGSFAATIGVTGAPVWPIVNYAGFVSSSSPASTILIMNGAIGFTSLSVASANNVNIASMLNAYNRSVMATALSATFAATELLAQSTSLSSSSSSGGSSSTLLPNTLTGPAGQQAWPMTMVSALIIHTNSTRSGSGSGSCETRAALVSFLSFLYTSSAASAILANRNYAPYPGVALSDLNLPGLLQVGVWCAGNGASSSELAYAVASSQSLQSTATTASKHTLYGDARFASVMSLIAGLRSQSEQASGAAIEIDYGGITNSWDGVQSVLSGTAEAALLTLDSLNISQQTTILEARNSGRFHLLPLFISALIPVYNPILSTNITLPQTITMDPLTLITLAGLAIPDWRSPQLATAVQPLSLSNTTLPLPIQLITPCDATAPGAALREFYSLFINYSPSLASSVYNTSSVLFSPCDSTLFYDTSAFTAGLPHGLFPAPTESAIPSIINAVPGSFSFQRATATATQADSGTGVVLVDFTGKGSGTGGGGITATAESMLACVESAFDSTSMLAKLNTSTNSSCYLFSRTVYAIVPTTISDTDGDGCYQRVHLLEFLRELTESSTYDALLDNELFLRMGQIEAVQVAVLNALNSIRCVSLDNSESDTLLVQTPVLWQLSSAVTTAGVILGAVGIVASIASVAVTAVFHRHSVMRAASPLFLCMTLLGLVVMFTSSVVLALPPSVGSCTALSWCFHLGFQLAFGPLLAKTYRVYRIYGGTKLNVVKISNQRLALLVAALLTMEIVLLSVLQAVSPMRPLTVSRLSGSPLRVHNYDQCSVDSAGLPIFVALCIEKGLVLLCGALMAFSTRRVSATYSESSSIAWSIYNIILSLAVFNSISIVN